MSSSKKKYQIFISSTYTDLIEERNEVMKAILSHYHIPIGMEMFSAGNDEQWETIKDTIDSSDYYVLIIGGRYGSCDNDGMGFTEKEFLYAKSQGIPVLVFIRDRDHPTKPKDRDDEPAIREKLNLFIESAKNNRLVAFWKLKEDLAMSVMGSFHKAISKNDRVGWVRADSVPNANEVLAEMASLQRENRELKIQMDGLLGKREPKFVLEFNEGNELKIVTNANNLNDTMFIKQNAEKYDYHYFQTLKNYNLSVAAQKTNADKFNIIKLLYWIETDYKSIEFKILNNGRAKASGIQIILDFPKELNLLIGTRNQVPKFTPEDYLLDFGDMKFIIPKEGLNFRDALSQIPLTPSINNPWEIARRESQITIRVKSLLHTNEIKVKGIFVSGSGKSFSEMMKVSVICEEMPEREEFEVPITYEYIDNPGLIDSSVSPRVRAARIRPV